MINDKAYKISWDFMKIFRNLLHPVNGNPVFPATVSFQVASGTEGYRATAASLGVWRVVNSRRSSKPLFTRYILPIGWLYATYHRIFGNQESPLTLGKVVLSIFFFRVIVVPNSWWMTGPSKVFVFAKWLNCRFFFPKLRKLMGIFWEILKNILKSIHDSWTFGWISFQIYDHP